MKKTRITVKHIKGCWAEKSKKPWSGIIEKSYWGNFAANSNAKSTHHIWHPVLCNNPKCPAIKAVHSSILRDA